MYKYKYYLLPPLNNDVNVIPVVHPVIVEEEVVAHDPVPVDDLPPYLDAVPVLLPFHDTPRRPVSVLQGPLKVRNAVVPRRGDG